MLDGPARVRATRVDALLSGAVPAAAIWSAPTYLVEQRGAR
jgi:hypothetical protein